MTTNLFVIVNVKQLWTGGSFRISLPFFWTSWGVGVLNSAIFKLIRMLEWDTKHFPLNLQSGLTLSNYRDAGGGFELRNQIRHCKTVCIKRNLYLINYNRMRTQWTTKGNRDAGSSCSCDRRLHPPSSVRHCWKWSRLARSTSTSVHIIYKFIDSRLWQETCIPPPFCTPDQPTRRPCIKGKCSVGI